MPERWTRVDINLGKSFEGGITEFCGGRQTLSGVPRRKTLS